MPVAAALESLDTRVRALSGRERLLLYGAVLLTPFLLIFQFAVVPQEQRLAELDERIEQTRADTRTLREQTAEIAVQDDPLQTFRQREREAREQAAEIERRLQTAARDLLGPDRTARLLRELLAERGAIEPETLVRRAPETLARGDESGIRIRSHRIELAMTGDYLELLRYVRHLEALPMLWLWGDTELTLVDGTPRLRLAVDAMDLDGLEETQ
ncbi:hypothetical protein [Thioalkalivibrio sp. ALgr3]|uniref:hypothetical protein n=1 Tax=Thioalkalivibrio sp. ALgr3 TaxID=1239292 RepID=UPI00039EEB36|nr:hypothetical protein [Thioalkalivibrio sp. ALgr3]